VLIYYCYIESWTLAWTFFSLTGATQGSTRRGCAAFWDRTGPRDPTVHGIWVPSCSIFVTIGINFWVVSRGISGGIEKLAKIAMPVLFVFAAVLVIRVLTLDPQTPPAAPTGHSTRPGRRTQLHVHPGLVSARRIPKVWLAATGQIFFTLSVGMGTLQAYASYLRKQDDIVLSGIATASTNETAEVVLGGSLAIPAVVTFFGVSGPVAIARRAARSTSASSRCRWCSISCRAGRS
jgi:neurotransmitter:Na+ symporter, NSS family